MRSAATDIGADALAIDDALRRIRRRLWHSFEADIERARLTLPQLHLLEILSHDDGLRIGTLARRLELSQSTVSGIVDRLGRQNLVERRTDPSDRRTTRVYMTQPVRAYIAERSARQRLAPLVSALVRATPTERQQVLEGLEVLLRLLSNEPGIV